MRPRFTLMSAILKRNDSQPSSAASRAIWNSMRGPPTFSKLDLAGGDPDDAEDGDPHHLPEIPRRDRGELDGPAPERHLVGDQRLRVDRLPPIA